MRQCSVVVGNSSSGIIEAPSVGVPTVNIGDRQKGRVRAETVIECGVESDEILSAINKALAIAQARRSAPSNPYEGTNTAETIVKTIVDNLTKGIYQKAYYDLRIN